jgi:hypothetical protein
MVVKDPGLELACAVALGAVWLVMHYIRTHVPHGEARFDSETGKPKRDD